jgi:predicted component of type VI protein secretion system
LFENATPLTANFIKNAVQEVIENNEPRVKLTEVRVVFDGDNNGFAVTLSYIILNRSEPVVTTIFLERIR